MEITFKNKNGVGMSIACRVFNYCQHEVLSVKEGDILYDLEQISVDNNKETAVDADETPLFRMRGFALHSTIKNRVKSCADEMFVWCKIQI